MSTKQAFRILIALSIILSLVNSTTIRSDEFPKIKQRKLSKKRTDELPILTAATHSPFTDIDNPPATKAPPISDPIVITSVSLLDYKSVTPGSAVCAKTGTTELIPTTAGICSAYFNIREEFQTLIKTDYSKGKAWPRSNLFGQAIRFVFHDAAEVNINSSSDRMRSDGCISNTVANKGLLEEETLIVSVMDPIWQKYCDQISRADFYVLFATLVIEEADNTNTIELGYQYGRQDTTDCAAGSGRLPNAQQGMDMYDQIFVKQMGLTLEDAVTLVGAHTIGHVHPEHSGYGTVLVPEEITENAWDTTPTVFDNLYYANMVNRRWENGHVVNDDPQTKNIWDLSRNGNIMLNSDIVIGFEIDLTTTGDCIACGSDVMTCGTVLARDTGFTDYQCLIRSSAATKTQQSTFPLVKRFAESNAAFLIAFATSWSKMSAVGYQPTELTTIDLSTCAA